LKRGSSRRKDRKKKKQEGEFNYILNLEGARVQSPWLLLKGEKGGLREVARGELHNAVTEEKIEKRKRRGRREKLVVTTLNARGINPE